MNKRRRANKIKLHTFVGFLVLVFMSFGIGIASGFALSVEIRGYLNVVGIALLLFAAYQPNWWWLSFIAAVFAGIGLSIIPIFR